MTPRPKITVELTKFDKALEQISWCLLLVLWMFTLKNYTNLPQTIPTHFSLSGEVDGYGGKETLFILPIIATLICVGFTILNKYPHIFNYPTEITEENAYRQYQIATRLLRWLKVIIVLTFSIIVYTTIQKVQKSSSTFDSWLIPFILVFNLVPLVIYFRKSLKK